jgi:hypothetical protein
MVAIRWIDVNPDPELVTRFEVWASVPGFEMVPVYDAGLPPRDEDGIYSIDVPSPTRTVEIAIKAYAGELGSEQLSNVKVIPEPSGSLMVCAGFVLVLLAWKVLGGRGAKRNSR